MTGIYKITNPNNEIYIGGTIDFNRRIVQYRHSKGQGRLIQESLDNHGFENHAVKLIHELPADISQDVLDRYEQLYMDLYKDCGVVLLNLKMAGRGGKHGEKTKIKMSISATGKKISETHRRNMSISQTGRIHSEEVKQKIRMAHIGKTYSKETIERMRMAKVGKKTSEETKRKIAAALTGGKNKNAKKVINTLNGIIYDCVGDAAKHIVINRGTLTDYLNGNSPNKTTLRYL